MLLGLLRKEEEDEEDEEEEEEEEEEDEGERERGSVRRDRHGMLSSESELQSQTHCVQESYLTFLNAFFIFAFDQFESRNL